LSAAQNGALFFLIKCFCVWNWKIYLKAAGEATAAALAGKRTIQVYYHVPGVVVDFHVEGSKRTAAISHQAIADFFGLEHHLTRAVLNQILVLAFKARQSCSTF